MAINEAKQYELSSKYYFLQDLQRHVENHFGNDPLLGAVIDAKYRVEEELGIPDNVLPRDKCDENVFWVNPV
jgi:hypothetical protein